jgi:hypothetical protein
MPSKPSGGGFAFLLDVFDVMFVFAVLLLL